MFASNSVIHSHTFFLIVMNHFEHSPYCFLIPHSLYKFFHPSWLYMPPTFCSSILPLYIHITWFMLSFLFLIIRQLVSVKQTLSIYRSSWLKLNRIMKLTKPHRPTRTRIPRPSRPVMLTLLVMLTRCYKKSWQNSDKRYCTSNPGIIKSFFIQLSFICICLLTTIHPC